MIQEVFEFLRSLSYKQLTDLQKDMNIEISSCATSEKIIQLIVEKMTK